MGAWNLLILLRSDTPSTEVLPYALAAIFISWLLLQLTKIKRNIWLLFSYLGAIAYELYLVHYAFIYSVDAHYESFPVWVRFVIFLSYSIGLAFLVRVLDAVRKLLSSKKGALHGGSFWFRVQ